jgi:hypothetical protein
VSVFDIIVLAGGLVKIIIGRLFSEIGGVVPHHPGIAELAAGELAMTIEANEPKDVHNIVESRQSGSQSEQPHLSQAFHAPASFLAIVATWRPWNLAMASSFSLGRRLPSPPAIVEAP